MGVFIMIRIGLVVGALAAVGGFVWDYKATKSALKETRLELASKKVELKQVKIARDVALEFDLEDAEREAKTKTKIRYIRRRPDGNEAAAAIILDTVNGLRDDASGVPASDN